jgi:hypothetical protein
MSTLPIACSLSASELRDRTAAIAQLGRHLVRAERDGARAVLTFAPGHGGELRALAAAEARCCPFLTLVAGEAMLTIAAADDAAPVVEELVAAFGGAA